MPGKNNRKPPEMFYRASTLKTDAAGKPSTINEEERSVESVIATESPVRTWSWRHDSYVDEILLMSGVVIPENAQVPLLDSHSRYQTSSVLGSTRNIRVEGQELVGRDHFSSVDDAKDPWTKTVEGHLTDRSAGYAYNKEDVVIVADGESTTIDGRTFKAEGTTLALVTKWVLRENSICPIGADANSKARSEDHINPATPQAALLKKENNVDEKLRALLERRGLPTDATEADAWAFMERMETPPAPAGDGGNGNRAETVDIEKERAAAAKGEQDRISSINSMCETHECRTLADGLIKDGKSVDQARSFVMAHIETRNEAGDSGRLGFRVEVGAQERDKFREAGQDALLFRAGMAGDVSKLAPGYDEVAGFSMVEMARRSLIYAGRSDRGRPLDMVGRALTTSDFPILISNVANRSLFTGFDEAEETWQTWCAEGSVSNFLTHSSPRVSESDDLDEIPEQGEYEYGDMDEAQEQYKIATYGKLFAISRQAIINDDMGILTTMPRRHGEAASRKIGDVAYAVLMANSAMGDNKALFDAAHKNLGAAAALGTGSIAQAIHAMKTQKGMKGKQALNIQARFYIAPSALEGSSEIFFGSNQFADDDKGATRTNPYGGNRFKRIYEPRLDDHSATSWYLAGAKGKQITVFFLDGVKKPYMETKNGWSVDGIEYKVRIDAGAKALDWKALYKNPGAE